MYFSICTLVLALVGQGLAGVPWVAEPRDADWIKKHQHLVDMSEKYGDEVKIAFIGDSITENWAKNGKKVWDKYYSARHAFNYGIGGDKTEHVLYRIEKKEFDGLKPNVAVIMIGNAISRI